MSNISQMITLNSAVSILSDTSSNVTDQERSKAFLLELIKAQTNQSNRPFDHTQVTTALAEFNTLDLNGDFTISKEEIEILALEIQSKIMDELLTKKTETSAAKATPDIASLFARSTYQQAATLGTEFQSGNANTKQALLTTTAPSPFAHGDRDLGTLFASIGDYLSGGKFSTTG